MEFLVDLVDLGVIGVGRGVTGAAVTGATVGSLGSSISNVEGLSVEIVGVALGEAEGLEVGDALYKLQPQITGRM